jgi:hypothetical protein
MLNNEIRILTFHNEDDTFVFRFDESVLHTVGNNTFEYWRVTDITEPEDGEILGYITSRPGESDEELCKSAYELWQASCHVTIGR